jgi:excisionase family DNA binding protein
METIQEQLTRIENLLKEQKSLHKEIFTLEEVAVYLGQSKSSIYKLTSKKEIPFYTPGGKMIYFQKSEIDAWVLKRKIIPDIELEQDLEKYLSRTLKV